MKNTKLFLKKLTEMLPPGTGQRHNLTIDEEENLILHFMLGSKYFPVLIDIEERDIHEAIRDFELRIIPKIKQMQFESETN